MKNKNLKIAGLAAVLVVGLFALMNFKKKNQSTTPEKAKYPTEFTVKSLADENLTTSYWYAPATLDYWKNTTSPLSKSQPVKITQQEFEAAYDQYLK